MGNPRKAKLSSVRRVLKIFHPEGIPWPGTAIYNAVSNTGIFQRNYELVARDILSYGLGDNILDIGTGPGWLLVKLHQEHSGLKITGLDASYSMVAMARRNMLKAGLADIIKIKKGNTSNMSFPDHSFDTVVSTESIHHWKDPTASLNEIYRVLKHGGYALMYDLVSDTPKSVINVAAHEFGRFKMILLWLHAFEEPFYSCRDFELLARPTLFREGRIKFVGVSCCLILRKEDLFSPKYPGLMPHLGRYEGFYFLPISRLS